MKRVKDDKYIRAVRQIAKSFKILPEMFWTVKRPVYFRNSEFALFSRCDEMTTIDLI